MSARLFRILLAAVAAFVVLGATAATAADVALPQDLTSGGVKWEEFQNHIGEDGDSVYGCTSLDHAIATGGDYLPGYGPQEARNTDDNDGFDTYALVTVDGSYFLTPGATADLTGQSLTPQPENFGGVQVSVTHTALTGQPILRTFVSLTNNTAAAVTKTVTFEQDLGSDDSTWVQTTSSGDDSWVTGDRWAITSQGEDPSGDPVITTVLYGPGTVASPQTNLDLCGERWDDVSDSATESAQKDGAQASAVASVAAQTSASHFSVTIPAGETRSLAFFNAATPTDTDDEEEIGSQATGVTGAQELTPLYNAGLTGPLAEGLTADQVKQTVNWSPEIPAAVIPAVVIAPRFTG